MREVVVCGVWPWPPPRFKRKPRSSRKKLAFRACFRGGNARAQKRSRITHNKSCYKFQRNVVAPQVLLSFCVVLLIAHRHIPGCCCSLHMAVAFSGRRTCAAWCAVLQLHMRAAAIRARAVVGKTHTHAHTHTHHAAHLAAHHHASATPSSPLH